MEFGFGHAPGVETVRKPLNGVSMPKTKSPPLAHHAFTTAEKKLFHDMDREKKWDQWMDELFPWDVDAGQPSDPF